MKMETTAGMLKAALTSVGNCVEKRTIPILGCVRIGPDGVSATDLDRFITVPLPSRGIDGEACIPLRPLRALLAHLSPTDVISISTGADGATVKFDGTCYELPATDAADFPEIDVGETAPINIDGDALKTAIRFCAPAVSTEETRYYLNGISLYGDVAVATNGHRMAVRKLGFDCSAFRNGILPRPLVLDLLRLPAPERMAANFEKCRLLLHGPGYSIRAKLIDGAFPDWTRVQPVINADTPVVMLDPTALLRALRRILSIFRHRPQVTMAWNTDRMVIAALDHEGMTGREEIEVAANLPGARSVNPIYASETLRSLGAGTLTIEVPPDRGPTRWRVADDAWMLVMPMRDDEKALAMARETLGDGGASVKEAA